MVGLDRARGVGRAEQAVPEDLARRPTLSDAQLAELGEVGKVIARHFEFEADVEWAYQGGALYVLQARRIRNLAPPPQAAEPSA